MHWLTMRNKTQFGRSQKRLAHSSGGSLIPFFAKTTMEQAIFHSDLNLLDDANSPIRLWSCGTLSCTHSVI